MGEYKSTYEYIGFDATQMPPSTKPIVFISGTWYEMGRQFAEQAGPAVRQKIAYGMANAIKKYGTRRHALECVVDYTRIMEEKAPELLNIWYGIADETGLQREDIMLAYTNFSRSDERCSTISVYGSATKDGQLICGMNCDEDETVNFYAPTVIAYPDEGNAFISASAFTCNCVMNEAGVVFMASCGQSAASGDYRIGLPNCVELMICAAKCSSAKEAVDLVIENKLAPSSGENIHFADISGKSYVIEHTAQKDSVRVAGDFGEKCYTIATNTFFKEKMQPSVWTGKDKWDNPLPRYWTEERIILENFGNVDIDIVNKALSCRDFYIRPDWNYTKWETDVVGFKYGWNRNIWAEESELAKKTSKWSPEIRTPIGKTVFSCIMEPAKNRFYITNGSRDPLISMNADATGNFLRITLRSSFRQIMEDAMEYAREQVYFAVCDINLVDENRPYRIECLNTAKQAYFEGINYMNIGFCAENSNEQRLLWGKATTAFCKAQCYSQLAQKYPYKLQREKF